MQEDCTVRLGTFRPTPAMIDGVCAVLRSGRLSYGPVSRQLEERFAALHGCSHGVLSNSGTSSLVVAIQALKELYGWQDGDEVIVPSLTFVATLNAVIHNNLTPVVADVDATYYDLDPWRAADAITDRTRALLPANLFGQPADLPALSRLARDHNLKLIEDSCESMFVDIRNQSVGAWGDVACFSMYMAHILVAGVGGIAITHQPALAAKMRSLVNHGIDLSELPAGTDYEPSFLARNFRFGSAGHSFRITEMEAAVALAQLDEWQSILMGRQWAAACLSQRLAPLTPYLQLPEVRAQSDSSWMVYPLVLRRGSKWPLMHHLRAAGIECREMLPLTNQPYLARYGVREQDYPVAQGINQRGLYLPCHQDLTDLDLDRMVEALNDFFKQEKTR